MQLNGIAPSHIRVLTSMRSIYVSQYITRFRVVHPHIPLPKYIVDLASPEDMRSAVFLPISPPSPIHEEVSHGHGSHLEEGGIIMTPFFLMGWNIV